MESLDHTQVLPRLVVKISHQDAVRGLSENKIIDHAYSHCVHDLPWNRENSLCKNRKELSNTELLKLVPEVGASRGGCTPERQTSPFCRL